MALPDPEDEPQDENTETLARDRDAGRALAWLGALVLLGWVPVDWVFARENWISFALARIGCAILLAVFAGMLAKTTRQSHIHALTFLVAGVYASLVGWMMSGATGTYNIYLMEFSLVIWSTGLALSYPVGRMVSLQVMMLVLVAGTQLLHPGVRTDEEILFAIFYLATSATLCSVFSAVRLAGLEHLRQAKRAQNAAEVKMAEERASNVAKSAFLARMSHELRTPLNAILGYSELIEEELADAGVELVTDDLGKVKRAGHHLLMLIDDILDLSRIEAGELVIEPQRVAIAPLIDDVLSELWNLAARKRIHLQAEIAPDLGEINTDPRRARQIVVNLVTNALKFTDRGGVQLIANRTTDGIRIEVHDSGVGIADNDLDRVFEPFIQVDSTTTRKNGGSGLGLAIVRDLAVLLGGKVSVASVPDAGSTFIVELGDLPLPVTGRT